MMPTYATLIDFFAADFSPPRFSFFFRLRHMPMSYAASSLSRHSHFADAFFFATHYAAFAADFRHAADTILRY